jgi:hypothetical protein
MLYVYRISSKFALRSYLVMESLAAYQYQPLRDPKDIRLLKVLLTEEVACKVYTFPIGDPETPPYVALSYAWGVPVFDRTIQLDETSFPITQNLYGFLHNWGKATRLGRKLLWIDAVCINQQDEAEKGVQVRLMRQIYENASHVNIWLGEQSEDGDFALFVMKHWSEYLRDLLPRDRGSGPWEDVIELLEEISSSNAIIAGGQGSNAYKACTVIQRLFQRPWWRRAWIIQEATANVETMVLCGDRYCHWEAAHSAVVIAERLALAPGFAELGLEPLFSDHDSPTQLCGLRKYRLQRPRLEWPLLTILHLTRFYGCADDRDRLYAAINVATDVMDEDFTPDYRRPVVDAFIDVVKFVLDKAPRNHKLDFLGYVVRTADDSDHIRAADDSIPSWLPDWRTQILITPFR